METIHVLKKNSFLIVSTLLCVLLLYTRFVNIGWGLPYPFHPDERNMADALTQLHCTGFNRECLNPHFFAYGQLPLYVGYIGLWIFHSVIGKSVNTITFNESVIILRIISACASLFTFLVIVNLSELFIPKLKRKPFLLFLFVLPFIFSPALIQFAHFGTTESLLMLFYSLLIYLCTLFIFLKISSLKFSVLTGIVCGVAIATKVSSLIFCVLPMGVFLNMVVTHKKSTIFQKIRYIIFYISSSVIITAIFSVLFSPFNFISWSDFLGSMQYESSVGLGTLVVFYTRQFFMTLPVFFQLKSIFPYALGLCITCFSILGLLFLPNKKEFNVLRFAFLIYFLPSAYVFTKWTRFMAPLFPLMIFVAILFIYFSIDKYFKKTYVLYHIIIISIVLLSCISGFRFLTIYRSNDTRFEASDWIYGHIPPNSTLLSETANVVDIPIVPPYKTSIASYLPQYNIISFNFYDLDTNPLLIDDLRTALSEAQYIIIPSRRIFANQTCLNPNTKFIPSTTRCKALVKKYPLVNKYYKKLFSGELGFKEVKKFDLHLHDEKAEETWTVFDHPTIRIFKKVSQPASSI